MDKKREELKKRVQYHLHDRDFVKKFTNDLTSGMIRPFVNEYECRSAPLPPGEAWNFEKVVSPHFRALVKMLVSLFLNKAFDLIVCEVVDIIKEKPWVILCERCGSDRHSAEEKSCCNCRFFVVPGQLCDEGVRTTRNALCGKWKIAAGIKMEGELSHDNSG